MTPRHGKCPIFLTLLIMYKNLRYAHKRVVPFWVGCGKNKVEIPPKKGKSSGGQFHSLSPLATGLPRGTPQSHFPPPHFRCLVQNTSPLSEKGPSFSLLVQPPSLYPLFAETRYQGILLRPYHPFSLFSSSNTYNAFAQCIARIAFLYQL